MAYRFDKTFFIVPQAIDVNSTTQLLALGTRVRATDPTYGEGEFIYLKGVASTVLGDAVSYNADDWTTTRLVANAIGPVAIAMSACVAGEFGWYQIFGKAVVKAATVVDNADPYTSGTAGTLDDTVTATERVKNAKFASADGTPAAGFAELEIAYPFVDNGVAA